MKKLSIGIQTFSEFKKNNLVYVDKTEIIHKLITDGKYYFLSRPRRFGKSLMLDTISDLFKGKKEAFENLWVYDKWDFTEKFHVVKISFTAMSYPELGLKKAIDLTMDDLGKDFGIKFIQPEYSGKFIELIKTLGKERPVVILIDEYDKPIVDYLEREKLPQADENRKILKHFYSGIKDLDQYIRFFMITGVSKFSQVSIFSDLNHLKDITTSSDFATIVGYSEDEIKIFYKDYLKILCKELELSEEEALSEIKKWYNGYSWDGKTFLHNPFSVINLFSDRSFKNYWFETGTPTFLIDQIKEAKENFADLNNQQVATNSFNKFDITDLDPAALMFQTGYLTIKEHDAKSGRYLLDYPNKEVSDSFMLFSLPPFTGRKQTESQRIVDNMIQNLETFQIERFIIDIRSLFSSIPGSDSQHICKYEGYYHSIVYIALKIMGIYIDAEVESAYGITDAVVKTEKYIYLLEFKMGSAESAIKQIEDKKYYEPYLADGREIILFGLGFSKDMRNVEEYLVKKLGVGNEKI